MKELKQDYSLKEYVKNFSNLMLQITNMSDEDLFFNFMDGLKPWAAWEISRHNVDKISTALTVAQTLKEDRPSDRGEGSRPMDNSSSHNSYPANGGGTNHKDKWRKQDHEGNKGLRKEDRQRAGCFLCSGPHKAMKCPKRKALTAMVEQMEKEEEEEEEDEATMASNYSTL